MTIANKYADRTVPSITEQIMQLRQIYTDLFFKLISFTLDDEFFQYMGEALEFFYNLEEGDEYEFDAENELLFLSWYLLDDADAYGNALIDEFLRRHAGSDLLSVTEKQIAVALKQTYLSVYTVEEVTPGESMILKDLFSGKTYKVLEASGTKVIEKGSTVHTRLLLLGKTSFMVGAAVVMTPEMGPAIAEFITEQYKEQCEEGYKASFKDFLKNSGELVTWWLRANEYKDVPNASTELL
ncbi:MAG: hypothetical protein GX221_10105 [Candidatus Riflebacteria bacterium]|nr:hypothetical protein [Candidatus Riflebacteria bacterium]